MAFPIIPIIAGLAGGAGMAIGRNAGRKKSRIDSSSKTYNVYNPDLSVHGQAYQDLAANNPYANVTYRQSWIQKVLQSLGFRTNKDSYLESMALQAQEYDNQLLQKEYNEKYDSANAQVARERAAGINPDLAGNVSAGDAAEPVDDGNPPVAPVADDLNMVQTFASGVLNAVQAAFGLYGQIQSIDQLKIQNENSMMSLVKSAWSMIIPDWYEHRNNSDGRIDVNNYWKSLHQHFGNTMSKKQFSNFVNRVNAFANSAEGWKMVYDTQNNKAKARKSMFSEFAGEGYSEWDDIMSDIGDELGNLAFEINKKSLENDKKYQEDVRPEELQNKEFYEQALDPTVQAKLDSNPNDLTISNAQAKMSGLSVEQAEYSKMLRGSFESIMKKLEKAENKGNKKAALVKAVLSVWLMGLMPQLPSISRSSRSGVGLNGTPFSQSSWSVK